MVHAHKTSRLGAALSRDDQRRCSYQKRKHGMVVLASGFTGVSILSHRDAPRSSAHRCPSAASIHHDLQEMY